jgi:hypothetical protein
MCQTFAVWHGLCDEESAPESSGRLERKFMLSAARCWLRRCSGWAAARPAATILSSGESSSSLGCPIGTGLTLTPHLPLLRLDVLRTVSPSLTLLIVLTLAQMYDAPLVRLVLLLRLADLELRRRVTFGFENEALLSVGLRSEKELRRVLSVFSLERAASGLLRVSLLANLKILPIPFCIDTDFTWCHGFLCVTRC